MSNIVTQYSRLSHHTITPSGTTFTVPVQEDFTLSPSGWTTTDLALSEIGVNETDNKAYIRIGQNINEIALNVTGGTLAIGSPIISGTPSEVLYTDNSGDLKSDTGFTYSSSSGLSITNSQDSGSTFEIIVGSGANFGAGVGLTYIDTTDGNNYQNIIGVLSGSTGGDIPRNCGIVGFTNNNTGDGAFLYATQIGGEPAMYMQTQYSGGGIITTIGISPELELVNMTDGNFSGSFDITSTGLTIAYNATSSGSVSSINIFPSTSGNTELQIQSNNIIWTWPNADGISGSTLSTDGNGNLSFKPIVLNGATGGEPSNPYIGQFYFDTSLNVLKFWDSKTWQTITSS